MRLTRLHGVLLAGLLATSAAADPSPEGAAEAHVRELERWRQERHERLSAPDGWFSLVGLVWLKEGENTCGSDGSSDVRFPDSLPPIFGALSKNGEQVEFESSPGSEIQIDGRRQRRARLTSDAEGEPTVLEIGSVRFYLIQRGSRIGVRIKDSQSAALLAFEGVDHYPVDRRWRTEARFVPFDPPKQIPVPNVLGTVSDEPSPGAVELRMAGRTHRLDVLSGGDGRYFIVFGDATNGQETYGGGRFLYADAADEDGRVVLDFNKSFNPPCAFTPYSTCPLPPRQNELELAVRAGERRYGAGDPH